VTHVAGVLLDRSEAGRLGLGLVRHLAETERATFRVLMAGQDVPRLF